MSDEPPFQKHMNAAVESMLQRFLENQRQVYDSPYMVAMRAQAKANWDALPWYVKAYRKSWLPETFWRIGVAFDVLRRGEQSNWLGD